MSPLEVKRKQLEIIKVQAAKSEMEFRIMEKEVEIDRLKENMKLQDDFVLKLQKELEEISSK